MRASLIVREEIRKLEVNMEKHLADLSGELGTIEGMVGDVIVDVAEIRGEQRSSTPDRTRKRRKSNVTRVR